MEIAFVASMIFGVLSSFMAFVFVAGLWRASVGRNVEKAKAELAREADISSEALSRLSDMKVYERVARRAAVARYSQSLVATLGMMGAAFGFASTYRFDTEVNKLAEFALVAGTLGTLASVIFLAIYNRSSALKIDAEIHDLELQARELKRAEK